MALISVRNVSKRYPGVHALDRVSLEIEAGTVHALMGENGAGKSTLGKILAGVESPDAGEIWLDGRSVRFRQPADAVNAGVSIVHQELLFCENLSVAENLMLDNLSPLSGSRGVWFQRAAINEQARQWLAAVGADIDPTQIVGELPIARQQMVQIAGAIGRGARVLIFDEPTSSLSHADTERLLALIRDLRSRGVACIYVSHRLDEVFAIADRVSVLRDGQHVVTKAVADFDRASLVRAMIGRDLDAATATTGIAGDSVLSVQNLRLPGRLHDISFQLHAGEILGLGGLVGAGRTEVAECLFGLQPLASGEICRRGVPYRPQSPQHALAQGFGLVPEDRKRHGLVLSMSSGANISLPSLDRVSRLTWIRREAEEGLVGDLFRRMRVKAPSLETLAQGLSGGNQQKLVLAKWVARSCDVLIVDEPTRGVDVGAKAEIHALLREIAASGTAILLISSDLPELLMLSSRILVMREGHLVGEVPQDDRSEEGLMRRMAGA